MAKKNPGSASDTPDRRALLQAYQDVVRSEKEKHGRPVPAGRPPAARFKVVAPLLLVLAGLIAVLVLRPAWLFTPPPAESPAIRDATLRVQMYIQIDRIERFRAAQRRLPVDLAEAGADTTGVRYYPRGDAYTLAADAKGVSLSYDSRIPPKTFLGDAYQRIQQRGKQ